MDEVGKKKFILTAIYLGAFGATVLLCATSVLAFTATYLSNATKAKIAVSSAPAASQSVVINEVMWMGSFGNPDDTWIELRNMTDQDINITNWSVTGATNGHGDLNIASDSKPKGKKNKHQKNKGGHQDNFIIPKHGYYLITHFDDANTDVGAQSDLVKGSLDFNGSYKKNGALILKDSSGTIVDKTPDADSSFWPAGWNGIVLHLSMERTDNPGNGSDAKNWHTCFDLKGFGTDYWKHIGFNCGTPGKENLDKNDKNSSDFDKIDKEEASPQIPADQPTGDKTDDTNSPTIVPDPQTDTTGVIPSPANPPDSVTEKTAPTPNAPASSTTSSSTSSATDSASENSTPDPSPAP